MDPVVVTGPLYPTNDVSVRHELIHGVPHYRTNFIPAPRSARTKLGSYVVRALMMRRYRSAVMEIVRRERPDVLHAHSSYLNARAALPAARRFNLPLVYEV